MTVNRFIAAVAFVGMTFSGVAGVSAAEKEELQLTNAGGVIVPMAPMSGYKVKVGRPAILPALYVTLGAMQALDIYSTRAAVQAGAREANAAAAPFTGSAASMLGMKAATTAGTIFFAERMWKKNKVGAVIMLVAINGATAAVSMRNMRNAKQLNTR
jgi:hypothetical protein